MELNKALKKRLTFDEAFKLLWHGSRSTNPNKIIQSDVGFDMRYAADGNWGKGIYFSEKVSYSQGFQH